MSAAQEIIPAAEVRAAEQKRASLIEKMANKYGLEPNRMMATLKATAFRGDVTNEQMAALLIVADQHNLNPWLKEIYAFPSRQGIVPIVGVDGWARIINEHPQFDGMDFEQDDEKCTCRIHRKDRAHPVAVTEYMIECKRSTDPWNTHPKRMLRHKAMIQAARLAFSFAGIYDPDEGERVLAAEEAIDVTPQPAKPVLTINAETGKPAFVNADGSEYTPPKKIGPKKLRETIEGIAKATENGDGPALLKIKKQYDNDQWQWIWGQLRSWEKTAARPILDAAEKADAGIGLDAISIESLRLCTNAAEHETAWRTIQDAYADNGLDVPETVIVVADEMRSSMGAV
jgi:phage recombination protein Bet